MQDLHQVLTAEGFDNNTVKQLLENNVEIAGSCSASAADAHAIALLTEWDEFAEADFKAIHASMKKPACIFDGRNTLKNLSLKENGFRYYGIGF